MSSIPSMLFREHDQFRKRYGVDQHNRGNRAPNMTENELVFVAEHTDVTQDSKKPGATSNTTTGELYSHVFTLSIMCYLY